MSTASAASKWLQTSAARSLREIFSELGLALLSNGRFREAAGALDQALKEQGPIPDSDVIHFHLAVAYQRDHNLDRAFKSYLEAVTISPQHMGDILPSVHNLLNSELAEAFGDWLEGEWHARLHPENLPLNLQSELARFLGRVNLYRGRYQRAAAIFEDVRKVDPDDPRVCEGLGEAHWSLHNTSEALEFLNRAYQLANREPSSDRLMAINAKLARVLEATGQYQSALDRVAESLKEGQRFAGELLLIRSRCCLALGRPSEALEAAEAASKRDSISIEARLLWAQALIATGEHQAALNLIAEASQIDPKRPEVLLYKAEALLESQSDVAHGRRLLARYADRAGDKRISPESLPPSLAARKPDPNALYFLAELYRAVGFPADALRLVEQALENGLGSGSDERDAPALQLQGELLKEGGETEKAAKCLYEAGRRYLWRKEYQMAVEQLSHSAELNPKPPATYWYWSEALRMLSYQPSLSTEEKKAAINESVLVWERSEKAGPPGTDEYWVYLTRAWINEQRSDLLATSTSQQRMLWWESVKFLEQAYLLNDRDEDTWASLTRVHRWLGNFSVALHAASMAWEIKPESQAVQEERAAILAEVGDLQAADEVIEKRRAGAASNWVEVLKAFILAETRQYDSAIAILDESIKAEPGDVWTLDLRARCIRLAYGPARAQQEYESIWSRYDPADFKNLGYFGSAAYYLGYYDKAAAILQSCSELSDSSCSNMYLGGCFLALGDLAAGEKYLARSIELMKTMREIDDTLREDLPEMVLRAQEWPRPAEAHAALQRIQSLVETRQADLKLPRTPESELQSLLDRLTVSGELDDRVRIAIYAGLGRLHFAGGDYPGAASSYLSLAGYRNDFSEFGRATRQVASGFQNEGDQLLKAEQFKEAEEKFRSGLNILLDETEDMIEQRANLQVRLALALFLGENKQDARTEFRRLLPVVRQIPSIDAGSFIGETCRKLLNTPQQYWALDDEWAAHASEPGADTELSRDLTAGRETLRAFLVDWLESERSDNPSQPRIPIVTPIALEIGSGLIPADTGDNWSLFKTYIPEMRDWFEHQMGITLPGVRVRGNESLGADGYAIRLYENFVAGGRTYPDMRFSPASSEALEKAGVPEEDLIRARNPVNGEAGYWVPRTHWDTVLLHHLDLWEEPLVFAMQHLKALLLAKIGDFLGIQEVGSLLTAWAAGSDSNSQVVARVLPDDAANVRFARVLRALAKERVPIKDLEQILMSLDGSGPEALERAIQVTRLKLRAVLPGNDSSTRRIEVPAELTRTIQSWTRTAAGETVFAPIPGETDWIISTIGDLVPSGEEKTVLVVDCPEIRPHLRRLIEPRYPNLMVLSSEELLPQAQPLQAAEEREGISYGA